MYARATYEISAPNFRSSDEILTHLWAHIEAQGYLSEEPLQGNSMILSPRAKTKANLLFVSVNILVSCPNFSDTAELLTNLWGQIATQSGKSTFLLNCFKMSIRTRPLSAGSAVLL